MEDPDERYMKLALSLAEKAKGRTSPNPMVGAVIVHDGQIVGSGYHQKAGTPHAEIHAIASAGNKAKGATIYVNLEPCSHYGRTGPCTQSIIEAGISRVVIAMLDPNPKVNGKGKEILEKHGIEVKSGVLEKEAKELNYAFIKYITTGLPFVILKSAMSLDGKIATISGHSKWITSEESRNMVHRIRNEVDAILVGIETVIKDDPLLTTRLPDGSGRDCIRIVLDSNARIPLSSKILNIESSAKTIIAVTKNAPSDRVSELKKHAEILTVSDINGKVDLVDIMLKLGKMEITSVLIEGGAEVNASALKQNIVDKIMIFIAPKIIGGRKAIGPIGGDGILNVSDAIKVDSLSVSRVGEDILITGFIKKPNI